VTRSDWALFGGGGAVLVLVALWARPVQAAEPRAVVPSLTVTSTCQGLNAALVHKLLRIELSTVLNSKPHDLRVHVSCKGHRATVRIVDTLTHKTVQRQFAVRHDRPDLERVIALASAQLFVVSWLELLTPASPHRPPPAGARATVHAARRVARRAVQEGLGWRPTLGLEGAVSLRDLARPMGVYGTALRFGVELGRSWQLTGALTFAGGRAARQPGEVELLLPGARLGALWRWFRIGHVELASELLLGVQYARLRGIPGDTAEGEVTDGLVGEVVLGSGPRLLMGRFRLSAQLRAGVTFPTLVGRVEGDLDVRPGLVWLGLSLVFEVTLW